MKTVNVLVLAIVVILSTAAGVAKVLQAPHELEFLQGFGFSVSMIVLFGLVQVTAGILLIPKKTRLPAGVLVVGAFVVSSVLIFLAGDLSFGAFSLLPVVLAAVIVYRSAAADHKKL